MHVQELLDAPPPQNPAPIYVFTPGKATPRARENTFEPFLAERAAKRLIDAYVDESNRDFAFSTFHADDTRPEHVVAEAQTIPFLAERRVVVLRNVERYLADDALATLVAYAENPAEFTVLILIAGKIDKRTRFYKACEKSGAIVECPMLEDRAAQSWVRDEAKARGVSLNADAAAALIGRSGLALSDVNNALNLVIDFVGPGAAKIAEEDVNAACADVAEEIVWNLTDAIASSQTGAAIAALRNLMAMGKHPDEILGTINWLIKTAYQSSSPALAGKVSPWQANKVRPLVEKFRGRLPNAFALCTDTQFSLRETGVDPGIALDLLVTKLAFPVKRAQ